MMLAMRNAIKMDDHAALLKPGVSDLSLSGDGNSIAESLLFHHCNAEEGFIDRFGVGRACQKSFICVTTNLLFVLGPWFLVLDPWFL